MRSASESSDPPQVGDNDDALFGIRDIFLGTIEPAHAEAVADFYKAAVEQAPWQPALQRLAEALDTDAALIARRDFAGSEGRIASAWGIEPGALHGYARRFAREDLWLKDDEPFATGAVLVGSDLVREATLVGGSFHREWLAPRGLQQALFIVLQRRGDIAFYLQFLRAQGRPAFSANEIALARTLAPRLVGAFQIGSGFGRQRVEHQAAFDALEAMPIGVVAVDRSGAIVRANLCAHAIIAAGEGLIQTEGGLAIERPGHRMRLRDMVAQVEQARLSGASAPEFSVYALPRYRQQRPLTCLFMPVAAGIDAELFEAPAAILFLGDPERPVVFDAARISRLYGLSRAEARVAALLARGLRLEEVADQLGIAYETVRKHLKQIFVKTGVSRQAELVRMLVTGPAGLALNATFAARRDDA
jgi:DNA-binding CsgD family transcriptional regulator